MPILPADDETDGTVPGELDAIRKRVGQIDARLDSGADRMAKLEEKNRMLLRQMTEMQASQKAQTNTLGDITRSLDGLRSEVADNTELTTEVRDFMRAGRAAASFLKYAGWAAVGVSTFGTSVYGLFKLFKGAP